MDKAADAMSRAPAFRISSPIDKVELLYDPLLSVFEAGAYSKRTAVFPTFVPSRSSIGYLRERYYRFSFSNLTAHRAQHLVLAKKRRNTRMRIPLPQRAPSIGLVWSPATAKKMKNTSAKFEIHNFIPYQLVVLASYVGNQLLRAYNRYGLSVPEWRVIVSIARGPVIANEIVMRVQLDEVTVHRAVMSLIKRGLVRRTIDIADRRRRSLHLTPSGKATYRAIVPLAREFEDWMLAKLPQNERKNFVRTLRKLCRNLHLITQCPSTKASAKGNDLDKYPGG